MASFFSTILSLFTGAGGPKAEATKAGAPAASQTYQDCQIFAVPQREGSQFRLAGRIEKQVNGEILVRSFIRADVFSSVDDAVETTFRKAQQIIDQHGPSLFADGEPSRQV
ncbi:HlyU family transcriptional regulator [Rhizobium tumorigenes]|uniref:HlyU family transcriptional regulator n=1 Tax=Rhizobium tumorigenes TaxID=2041385 RepID=A0AAF1KWF0_9HYPH|nr:HlyU family transcriptional regulator [Rhizobium tumorigenes]WFR96654.1 HlyU family transcriptional regulator [Rhizobium tumorigenes]